METKYVIKEKQHIFLEQIGEAWDSSLMLW